MAHRPVPNDLSAESFQIAWLVALFFERAAVLQMLDVRYERPVDFARHARDANHYFWGRVGGRNVVVVEAGAGGVEAGERGSLSARSAASAVEGLRVSLPGVRVGVFVGVGGGCATEGVWLGDVVVGSEGVVGLDFIRGRARREGGKGGEVTGGGWVVGEPPGLVGEALGAFRAGRGSRWGRFVEEALEKAVTKEQRERYGYPGSEMDGVRRGAEQPARVRPEIHFGTIASGNALIRDAKERNAVLDYLKEQRGIEALCLETAVSGLVKNFPCLVIRGICDYADGDEKKAWKCYASMTAAAFGKELMQFIDLEGLNCLPKIGESLKN